MCVISDHYHLVDLVSPLLINVNFNIFLFIVICPYNYGVKKKVCQRRWFDFFNELMTWSRTQSNASPVAMCLLVQSQCWGGLSYFHSCSPVSHLISFLFSSHALCFLALWQNGVQPSKPALSALRQRSDFTVMAK